MTSERSKPLQKKENKMEQKKLTGYPSIDKLWLKHYSKVAIHAPLSECNMYGYKLIKPYNRCHNEILKILAYNHSET